jgi:hypothetical protein
MLDPHKLIELNEIFTPRIFGYSESSCSADAYQFDNYSKYVAAVFDLEEKINRSAKIFPFDYKKAS